MPMAAWGRPLNTIATFQVIGNGPRYNRLCLDGAVPLGRDKGGTSAQGDDGVYQEVLAAISIVGVNAGSEVDRYRFKSGHLRRGSS